MIVISSIGKSRWMKLVGSIEISNVLVMDVVKVIVVGKICVFRLIWLFLVYVSVVVFVLNRFWILLVVRVVIGFVLFKRSIGMVISLLLFVMVLIKLVVKVVLSRRRRILVEILNI